LQTYFQLLEARGVEGFIAIDTSIEQQPPLSTVFVGGRLRVGGITNVTIDHKCAVRLALRHLKDLGHREIAFMQVHPHSPNSAARWSATCHAAANLGIKIQRALIGQVESPDSTMAGGYLAAKQLLEIKLPFTALFAYNDISAIGSIRAFREAGLRVPQDISVVGFDDIPGAGFTNPGLTTVRQPLVKMGRICSANSCRSPEFVAAAIHRPCVILRRDPPTSCAIPFQDLPKFTAETARIRESILPVPSLIIPCFNSPLKTMFPGQSTVLQGFTPGTRPEPVKIPCIFPC
jgi:hypothetical protein